MLTLMLLSLAIHAGQHGKPREPHNFPLSLVAFMISLLLLWQGGFFA